MPCFLYRKGFFMDFRKNQEKYLKKLVFSAMLLAIAMLLPFLTGQIPEIGKALCPMHIPVLLCGFICGWPWGVAVGFIAPLLRSVIFHRCCAEWRGIRTNDPILRRCWITCGKIAGFDFVKDFVRIYNEKHPSSRDEG